MMKLVNKHLNITTHLLSALLLALLLVTALVVTGCGQKVPLEAEKTATKASRSY